MRRVQGSQYEGHVHRVHKRWEETAAHRSRNAQLAAWGKGRNAGPFHTIKTPLELERTTGTARSVSAVESAHKMRSSPEGSKAQKGG